MKKTKDAVELELQKKLLTFLEKSAGVDNPINLYVEVEDFIENVVSPAYEELKYESEEEQCLEEEISELQNELEEVKGAFEGLQERGIDATSHAKELVQKAIDKIDTLKRIEALSVDTQNELTSIRDTLVGTMIDLEDDCKDIRSWDYC